MICQELIVGFSAVAELTTSPGVQWIFPGQAGSESASATAIGECCRVVEGGSEWGKPDRSERSGGAGKALRRLSSGFVPQRKLNAVVYTNLVVNLAEIVSHYLVTNSELVCNLAILEAKCHQLCDSKLAAAKLPCSV
jgi:hypothetical protein